jgi:hypothetical protein
MIKISSVIKYSILLLFSICVSGQINAQTKIYNCEYVSTSSAGKFIKMPWRYEITDSTITSTELSNNLSGTLKIISKVIGCKTEKAPICVDSYKISDGVTIVSIEATYYEKPPFKVKGKLYHYWITQTVNNEKTIMFGELQ